MKQGTQSVLESSAPVDSDRLTLEEVLEAVEMAWTDATNLPPETPYYATLCARLKGCAELIDDMIAHRQRMSGIKTGEGSRR